MIDYTFVGRVGPEAEGKVTVTYDTEAEKEQLSILLAAAVIYSERNLRYRDNWRRMGWRGTLIRIRERSERLWDEWWDGEPAGPGWEPDVDDALDLINFAAFHVRALRGETTRDGSWW